MCISAVFNTVLTTTADKPSSKTDQLVQQDPEGQTVDPNHTLCTSTRTEPGPEFIKESLSDLLCICLICSRASIMADKKMPLARRNYLKSLLLQIAESMIEEEEKRKAEEKQSYIDENCPSLSLPDSVQDLQELCRKLHKMIDLVDDERYDMEVKITKSNKEIGDLKIKLQDLKGKFKKPVLKRVRMSADAMLAALLGSKHKVSMDLRANLKQVKKEAKEEEKHSGDWRKNIEDKAGMDGRKKMFETEA